MSELYKVTFEEGEEICRFDGEISSPEWFLSKCGVKSEFDYSEDIIVIDNNIYIKDMNPYILISKIGHYEKGTEYNEIINQGYGRIQAYTINDLVGDKGAYIIRNPEWLKNLTMKDYSEFKKDYPFFNEKEYIKIMDSLNAYYKEILKVTYEL